MTPRGDSTGAKSTGTRIHVDNARGHRIPIGTRFFQRSLIVKVHPAEKKKLGVEGREDAWRWGARGRDLDPSAEG